ncbi:hypothetical protein Tco_0274233 [Tanacetum coccineum]
MKDQPLSVDTSPTALSPGYIANSDPEKDKEDPEEDETIMIMSHLMMKTMMMMLRRMRRTRKAFETEKFASTPPTSPYHIILSFETKSRAVRISI